MPHGWHQYVEKWDQSFIIVWQNEDNGPSARSLRRQCIDCVWLPIEYNSLAKAHDAFPSLKIQTFAADAALAAHPVLLHRERQGTDNVEFASLNQRPYGGHRPLPSRLSFVSAICGYPSLWMPHSGIIEPLGLMRRGALLLPSIVYDLYHN